MAKRLDIKAGDRFGKLTVIREIESRVTLSGNVNRQYECRCDCGEVDVFLRSRLYQSPRCYKCAQKNPLVHEEIQGEIWKPVVNWESCLEVSNLGRIRSIDRTIVDKVGRIRKVRGQAMRLQHDKDGYCVFGVKKHGKSFIVKVHRAVAEAFLLNPENKESVDHINGVRDDNRVENLRWCTTTENINFPIAKETRRRAVTESYNKNPNLREIRAAQFSKNQSKPCEVFLNGDSIGTFYCTLAAAKAIGIAQSKANKMALTGQVYKGYKIVRL